MQDSRGLLSQVNQFSNKLWNVIHKLELKEHQAIQSSEAPKLTNSNKYRLVSAFGIQVSLHTSGPELIVIHK